MTKRRKRAGAAQDSAQRPAEKVKRIKIVDTKKEQATAVMSLRCIQCEGNIADSNAGSKLSFFEDGNSLHLVMDTTKKARVCTGFKVKAVPEDKMPNDKNPYASVSHVLCANRKGGRTCDKKVGAVKCYPPFSSNRLIFFQHKALLINGSRINSWKSAREQGLEKVQLIPPSKEDEERKFKPQERPPLIRSVTPAVAGGQESEEKASTRGEGLTITCPRSYQADVFRSVVESKRNSLVYLPSGLGGSLVAAMILKRLMSLNPERQAYVVVETVADAMQQAGELQKEVRSTVGVLVGSSLGFQIVDGVDCDYRSSCQQKLMDFRAARLVVATAGALEDAMCKRYIDPDSICCVVLVLQDTYRHDSSKDNPLDRLAKTYFLPRAGEVNTMASEPSSASRLPKLVALMTSPPEVAFGGATSDDTPTVAVTETVARVEELLNTFGADLAAPVPTLQQVRNRTAGVELDIFNVSATPEETLLLRCLEKLLLGRVIKTAPDSDPAVQAQSLLHSAAAASAHGSDGDKREGGETTQLPLRDSVWTFPSQSHVGLCQQALTLKVGRGAKTAPADRGAEKGGGEMLSPSGGDCKTVDKYHLTELMNFAYRVDEIGGELKLRRLLSLLDQEMENATEKKDGEDKICHGRGKSRKESVVQEKIGVVETDELDRDDAIHVIRSYLSSEDGSDGEDVEKTTEAEAGAGGGAVTSRGAAGGKAEALGSKLNMMVNLLKEHKDRCDGSQNEFSALVIVSTNDLARAIPQALGLVPALKPFLRVQHDLKLSEKSNAKFLVGTNRLGRGIGKSNVIVSTSACSEDLELPDRGLVICADGTALTKLTGRLRCGESCRVVGLTRSCGEARLQRFRTLCQRESTMLGAIETLSGGVSTVSASVDISTVSDAPADIGDAAADTTFDHPSSPLRMAPSPAGSTAAGTTSPLGGSSLDGDGPSGSGSDGDGGGGGALVKEIPISTLSVQVALPAAINEPTETTTAAVPVPSTATVVAVKTSITQTESPAEAASAPAILKPSSSVATIVPDKPPSDASSGNGNGTEKAGSTEAPVDSVGDAKGWKKTLPDPPRAAVKKYAVTYLATCLRQTLQRHPDEMARCSINTTAQLAQAIKPVFEYDERRLPGQAHDAAFEARCFVWSRLEELKGLIVVKEAKGVSIKAAREGAAQKIMQYLLHKESFKAEAPSSSCASSLSPKTPDTA